MLKRTSDYSRLRRALGFTCQHRDERKVHAKVQHFLGQSFAATAVEFNVKIECAVEEIRSMPLEKYREPEMLEAAWQLAETPSPLKDWDFLPYSDPEKTGILCGVSGEKATLLIEESFKRFDLFGRETIWGNGVLDLYFSLSWWREAVCCIWASRIISTMIGALNRKQALALPLDDRIFSPQCFAGDSAINPNEPIGYALNLNGISDEEADNFYQLYEKASFGSAECEESSAQAFKHWLRSANIQSLKEHNLNYKEAHRMLFSGSQWRPEIEIELDWDQRIGAYQFICVVKNNDVHGYQDKERTSRIPAAILLDFFRTCEQKVKEDLFRLLIRGGWRKARDLLYKGFTV